MVMSWIPIFDKFGTEYLKTHCKSLMTGERQIRYVEEKYQTIELLKKSKYTEYIKYLCIENIQYFDYYKIIGTEPTATQTPKTPPATSQSPKPNSEPPTFPAQKGVGTRSKSSQSAQKRQPTSPPRFQNQPQSSAHARDPKFPRPMPPTPTPSAG